MDPEVFAASMIDVMISGLKPDLTKIDKALMKEGVGKCMDAMKPATTWPMNFDDAMYDQLKVIVNARIDSVSNPWDGAIKVGAVEGRITDVPAYLSKFSVIAPETKKALKKEPKLLGLLQQEFTSEQQAKIVGNPFLIGLLSIFGPMIVEFIKNWLSK